MGLFSFAKELDSFTAEEMSKKTAIAGEENKKKLIIQELKAIMEEARKIAEENGSFEFTYTSQIPMEKLQEIYDAIDEELWDRGFEVKETLSSKKFFISWKNLKRRDTDKKDLSGKSIIESDWILGTFKSNECGDIEDICGIVYYDKDYHGFCVDPTEGVPLMNFSGNVMTKEEVERYVATKATEKLST